MPTPGSALDSQAIFVSPLFFSLSQVFDVFLWIATLLSSSYVQASSRRMVNLSYGLWMASLNLMLLLQFLLLEACTVDAPSTATHKTTRRDVSCDDDQGATGAMNPSESWCARPPSSIIVEAINRNSLPFFLIVSEAVHTLPVHNKESHTERICHVCLTSLFIVMVSVLPSSATSAPAPSIFRCRPSSRRMRSPWPWYAECHSRTHATPVHVVPHVAHPLPFLLSCLCPLPVPSQLLSYLGVTCLAIVFADYRGWVIKL